MTRLTLSFTLFVFIAAVILSAPSASAQGAALIQGDYKRYAQFFKADKDPNFATSQSWRGAYQTHRWADYAAGTEFRNPILEAQTLTGIYLTTHIDGQLVHQIESIILNKAAMGSPLAEQLTLDLMSSYFGRATDPRLVEIRESAQDDDSEWLSEMELMRMQMMNRDIDVQVRRRIVDGGRIARQRLDEVRSTLALYRYHETDWESRYYHLRERINLLNDLAGHFPFNWETGSTKEEELREKLMNDERLRREIAREVRAEDAARRSSGEGLSDSGMSYEMEPSYDSGSSGEFDDDGGSISYSAPMMPMMPVMPTAMTEEEVEEEVNKRLPDKVDEKLKENNDKYNAFKYIVGVYQSSDYHMEALQRIHRYYRNAARAGDPIAQYHLALFLKHLGDIVDPYAEEGEHLSESRKWLEEARQKDVARERVKDLENHFAESARLEGRRAQQYDRKLNALIKVEEDKIDMYTDILLRVRERIASGSRGGSMMGGGGMMGGGNMGGGGRSGNRSRSSDDSSESGSP